MFPFFTVISVPCVFNQDFWFLVVVKPKWSGVDCTITKKLKRTYSKNTQFAWKQKLTIAYTKTWLIDSLSVSGLSISSDPWTNMKPSQRVGRTAKLVLYFFCLNVFLIFVWPSSKASFTTSVQRVLSLLTVAFSSWLVLFVTVTGRAGRSTGWWWQSRRLPQLWTVPGTLVRRRLRAQNWHQALVWPPQSEVYNFYSVL